MTTDHLAIAHARIRDLERHLTSVIAIACASPMTEVGANRYRTMHVSEGSINKWADALVPPEQRDNRSCAE